MSKLEIRRGWNEDRTVFVDLSSDVLDVDDIRKKCVRSNAGGTTVFVGTTRDLDEHSRTVLSLHYEAYEPMALSEMQRIGEHAVDHWKLSSAALVHRLGDSPVCDASVIIVATSKHRRESFQACEWMIDNLKHSVPIWKKEIVQDKSGATHSEWKANCKRCHEKLKE